jgi:hypothetical protein
MVANKINGQIKTWQGIPNKWQNILNYNKMDPARHKADGFFPVVMPALDPETQRRGQLIWDAANTYFTYEIIGLTQEEINRRAQDKEDADEASTVVNQRKADGELALDRIFALIERKYKNGDITAAQAKAATGQLYPLIEPLYKGLWILVKERMDNATVAAALQPLFNEIKSRVDNYVQNNY